MVVGDDGLVEALGAKANRKRCSSNINVPTNINPASGTNQTLIALMHRAIAQEHALSGSES
jgi:hypothetical protein